MIRIEKIKANLAEAIKNSKMTQKNLAQKIGVSQQTVSHYLNENKLPALDTLAKLCAVLDLDANEILCVEDFR